MKRLPYLLLAFLAIAATSCGGGDSSSADASTKVVRITMRDNSFAPDHVSVTRGETVRLTFTNAGTVTHEALLGDDAAQRDHEKSMTDDMGGMAGMDHGDGDAVTVRPGKTGSLTHTFDAAGSMLIGCHQPGHYMAGMTMTLTVT